MSYSITRLLHYVIALETHSSFEKECVGSDTESEIDNDTLYSKLITDTSYGNSQTDDFLILMEEDIPGSFLNGKKPTELNVLQLKRWLACRGAPVSGKKPDLIER